MSDELFERGLAIRRDVVGAEYVDRALQQAEEEGFGADFQRLVTEYCWGASWSRGALSRRDRSLLNLAMIGALGRGPDKQPAIARETSSPATIFVPACGKRQVSLPTPDGPWRAEVEIQTFVPAEVDPGSSERRALGARVGFDVRP